MKRKEVDAIEKLMAQLESTHHEMSSLSKKSPNGAVNVFKIKLINATLTQYNELLGRAYKPFADFESFSIDDVPSNSDVSFVVAQYLEFAEKFRADHIRKVGFGSWVWDTDGVDEDDDEGGEKAVPTSPPKKLAQK
jgi:hypothetical protein